MINTFKLYLKHDLSIRQRHSYLIMQDQHQQIFYFIGANLQTYLTLIKLTKSTDTLGN